MLTGSAVTVRTIEFVCAVARRGNRSMAIESFVCFFVKILHSISPAALAIEYSARSSTGLSSATLEGYNTENSMVQIAMQR